MRTITEDRVTVEELFTAASLLRETLRTPLKTETPAILAALLANVEADAMVLEVLEALTDLFRVLRLAAVTEEELTTLAALTAEPESANGPDASGEKPSISARPLCQPCRPPIL
jgi:hypothetical protein